MICSRLVSTLSSSTEQFPRDHITFVFLTATATAKVTSHSNYEARRKVEETKRISEQAPVFLTERQSASLQSVSSFVFAIAALLCSAGIARRQRQQLVEGRKESRKLFLFLLVHRCAVASLVTAPTTNFVSLSNSPAAAAAAVAQYVVLYYYNSLSSSPHNNFVSFFFFFVVVASSLFC